jgi:HSP20 family protein
MADTVLKSVSTPPAKTVESTKGVAVWNPYLSLRQEMQRLMDEFDGGFGRFPGRFFEDVSLARAAPAIDCSETASAFEVVAELPGVSEKDVHVEFANGELKIKGEVKEDKEERQKDFHITERRRGAFERRIRLPDAIDADKIEAKFKQGLLTVTVPKTAEAQKSAKRIAIKAD